MPTRTRGSRSGPRPGVRAARRPILPERRPATILAMPGLVLTAAGASTRFGGGADRRSCAPLAGVPVLVRARAGRSATAPGRLPIVVTARPEDVGGDPTALVAASRALARRPIVVEGGATRQESVRRGLAALPGSVDVVLVHDAARPLVTPDAHPPRRGRGRRATARPRPRCPSPTPSTASTRRPPRRELPRAALRAVQTPQAARVDLLRRAFAEAERRRARRRPTRSALLVAIGVAVTAVAGRPENLQDHRARRPRARRGDLARRGARTADAARAPVAPRGPRPRTRRRAGRRRRRAPRGRRAMAQASALGGEARRRA